MIIDERMSAFIDSLDSGNPAWLNEIEKYALDTHVNKTRDMINL